jgi:tRNA dimethylallyltransferase
VRDLQASGVVLGRTAARALGYSQVLALLRGDIDEPLARSETVDATKRFARRQQRWFNPDPRITWLDFDAPNLIDQALALWEASDTRT